MPCHYAVATRPGRSHLPVNPHRDGPSHPETRVRGLCGGARVVWGEWFYLDDCEREPGLAAVNSDLRIGGEWGRLYEGGEGRRGERSRLADDALPLTFDMFIYRFVQPPGLVFQCHYGASCCGCRPVTPSLLKKPRLPPLYCREG